MPRLARRLLARLITYDARDVPVAGRLGEVGDTALGDWMRQPTGPLLVSFEGRSLDLRAGVAEQCAWQRGRTPGQTPACTSPQAQQRTPDDPSAVFDVAIGSLTSAPPPAD